MRPVRAKVINESKEVMGKIFKIEWPIIVITLAVTAGVPGDSMKSR